MATTDAVDKCADAVIKCAHTAVERAEALTKAGEPMTARDVLVRLRLNIEQDPGVTRPDRLLGVIDGALNLHWLDRQMSRPAEGISIGF